MKKKKKKKKKKRFMKKKGKFDLATQNSLMN